MRPSKLIAVLTLLAVPALHFSGCDGQGAGEPDAGTGDAGAATVTLRLEHRVNGATLQSYVLDTPFTNAAGNQFGVTKLLYFLSNVTLTPAAGAPVVASGPHYVDHELAQTRKLDFAFPLDAGLASVSFVMGLPPELNVTGSLPNPPESLMEWPVAMGGGYHYMKLEGKFVDADGGVVPFKAHSGAAGGTDYSCPVTLDASGLTLSGSPATLTLVMNLEQWFEDPNTWDLNQYFQPPMYGMMNSQPKQQSLKENGATVFTLEAP